VKIDVVESRRKEERGKRKEEAENHTCKCQTFQCLLFSKAGNNLSNSIISKRVSWNTKIIYFSQTVIVPFETPPLCPFIACKTYQIDPDDRDGHSEPNH
jgi:hypothetical protein